jgi:ATP-dependent DNA helicase RecG
VLDLLYTFPYRYEDRRVRSTISGLLEGREQGFVGTVRSIRKKTVPKLKAPIIEAVVEDRSGCIPVVWFGQEYLLKLLPEGTMAFFYGKVEYSGFSRSLVLMSPFSEPLDPDEGMKRSYHIGRIVPVYREEEGISSSVFRRMTGDVLKSLWGETFDPLPPEVRDQAGVMEWFRSIVEIHFPKETDQPMDSLLSPDSPPRRRFIFEEFFFLEYLMLNRREGVFRSGRSWGIAYDLLRIDEFDRSLPFRMTSSQKRACRDILQDLSSEHPMNRFLLGDVGSGKTLVAAFAILQAMREGVQTALLAPTEILAQQHARTLRNLLTSLDTSGSLGPEPVLLSQSVKGSERRTLLAGIARGDVPVVVGTQALLEESVPFDRLGLVVIDEQHKFGVAQRHALSTKGVNPDILVMTATPIPRSLALSYYGDLELSVLDELPPGRKPVATEVVKRPDEGFWKRKVLPRIRKSEQAFVVLPLIEESEKVEATSVMEAHARISQFFPNDKIAYLTGRMEGEEKNRIMDDFRKGEISILVATTVIEVGVDVPNATLMIVENAERFGLAQLHQLRGRIGRGTLPGTCYLIPGESVGEEGKKRLRILEEYPDGFRVAEEDLRMRGPGEFTGVRQSGLPMFSVADLVRDVEVLTLSRRIAENFVSSVSGSPEAVWALAGLEEFIRFRYRDVGSWISTR